MTEKLRLSDMFEVIKKELKQDVEKKYISQELFDNNADNEHYNKTQINEVTDKLSENFYQDNFEHIKTFIFNFNTLLNRKQSLDVVFALSEFMKNTKVSNFSVSVEEEKSTSINIETALKNEGSLTFSISTLDNTVREVEKYPIFLDLNYNDLQFPKYKHNINSEYTLESIFDENYYKVLTSTQDKRILNALSTLSEAMSDKTEIKPTTNQKLINILNDNYIKPLFENNGLNFKHFDFLKKEINIDYMHFSFPEYADLIEQSVANKQVKLPIINAESSVFKNALYKANLIKKYTEEEYAKVPEAFIEKNKDAVVEGLKVKPKMK